MKSLFTLLFALATFSAHAALNVFATVPEWGALAREIGGDKVLVFTATTAQQDPHHIDARPSLIARARNADLLLATGAELEAGWLPVIQREAANPRIQSGQPGEFIAAACVSLRDAPARLDRAEGDVHAAGNPHIQTDGRNFLPIAAALAARMAQLDPANAASYRQNGERFAARWRENLARWEKLAAPLHGVAVVSQHKAWPYLYAWLGLNEIATLEPKPGVEPSVASLIHLREQTAAQPVRMVIRAAYNSEKPAAWFAAAARVPVVVLPFTVGGTADAMDLAALFDSSIARLLKGLQP